MSDREVIKYSFEVNLNKEKIRAAALSPALSGDSGRRPPRSALAAAASAACAAALLLALVLIWPAAENPTASEATGADLTINAIDNETFNRIGSAKLDARVMPISVEALPHYLLPEATLPEDFDAAHTRSQAVYFRSADTGEATETEYDELAWYEFYFAGTDEDRGITLRVSLNNMPTRDYYFSHEVQASDVGGVQMTIYGYEDSFLTQFTHKGYYFDIETCGITKDELAIFLTSLVA